uniref:Uncharacterized protein n=1 Tax=Amphimedon queenslandica TaxID=400682 RepID=A0A1X7UPS0_AMPQE
MVTNRLRFILVAPVIIEIQTDSWIDRTNFLDDRDEDEKRWLNKTAVFPIFDFSLRQGLEQISGTIGVPWSRSGPIRSLVSIGARFPCIAKLQKSWQSFEEG